MEVAAMEKIIRNPDKNYFAISLCGESDIEILGQMADEMHKEGYVTELYHDAVIKREEAYPTGLPTGIINVAIPHTEPEYVKEAAICLGILKRTVNFKTMGLEGETVEVSLVFMLAIKHKEDHLGVLQRLVSICQTQDILSKLLTGDIEAVDEVMTKLMENEDN
jgi:PTS system galactitol-specific IIA component